MVEERKVSQERVHLQEAKRLYRKGVEEFELAKEKEDGVYLRDVCGKCWLAVVEATNALLVKKGIREEELPKTHCGRRYMVFKYAERELEWLYLSLRESFHIEGYYDGSLSFDEVERRLDDLKWYLHKIEER